MLLGLDTVKKLTNLFLQMYCASYLDKKLHIICKKWFVFSMLRPFNYRPRIDRPFQSSHLI